MMVHYELEAYSNSIQGRFALVYCVEIAVVALGFTVLLGDHDEGFLLFFLVPSSLNGEREERER